jgi:hypothetical protein
MTRSCVICVRFAKYDWNYRVEDDEVGGACSAIGEKRNLYRLLVGKPEGKRPLRRPIRSWVDNFKMDLVEIGLAGVDWIGLNRNRDKWKPFF